MTIKDFTRARKRLQKTQKELASLLGVSLKAVCSYEQGWRAIPGHVERQLIFLLSRRVNRKKEPGNCWEVLDCPDSRRLKCPAWEFNSGNLCWFINGTLCENRVYKNWDEKMVECRKCPVMKKII